MINMRLREVYRYLGYRKITPTPEIDARIQRCIGQMQTAATPRAMARRFSVQCTAPDLVEIAGLVIRSRDLYRNLAGCDDAYLFAATIGIGIDHLIKRGEVASMTDSIIYQAAGAEMIESYADSEVQKLRDQEAARGYRLRPRYSPGYGDLPLTLQADFARILEMQKWCGISLTDALLMVPSKSITAFIGCTRETKSQSDGTYLAKEINPLKLGASAASTFATCTGTEKSTDASAASTPATCTGTEKSTDASAASDAEAPRHPCAECLKTDCLYREIG